MSAQCFTNSSKKKLMSSLVYNLVLVFLAAQTTSGQSLYYGPAPAYSNIYVNYRDNRGAQNQAIRIRRRLSEFQNVRFSAFKGPLSVSNSLSNGLATVPVPPVAFSFAVEPLQCGVAKLATTTCGGLVQTSASRAKRFAAQNYYKCPVNPPHAWPWLAFLPGGDCAAVLIEDPILKLSSRFLLSTAHCWLKRPKIPTEVILGGHDLRLPNLRRKIAKHFLHPNYYFPNVNYFPNGINPWNDIIVLKLSQPVYYSDTIRPICLSDIRDDLTNDNVECVAAGWGCLSELQYCSNEESYPFVPNQVVLRPTKTCKFPKKMLCAGYKGKDGPSFRDSGGPLVCRKSGTLDPWSLAGLVHGGFKDIETVAFTKVSLHWNWINDVLSKNYL